MKTKFDRAIAEDALREILPVLTPGCERIIVAGSLRRRREAVGDVEILYIPRYVQVRAGLFEEEPASLADAAIATLEATRVLSRRLNSRGAETFGFKNKLMVHSRTGLPVDLFSATESNWWNYLVCRTGPAESNVRIATAAKKIGWQWNPYGEGFSKGAKSIRMESEPAVFAFVKLPYAEPWNRVS